MHLILGLLIAARAKMMDSDGSNYREITSGDTVDSSPAWIPGAPKRMVFQSAGLARNEQGYILAQGNPSIQKLDMESGSVTPILDDPAFDFLKPSVAPTGDLLFIRPRSVQGVPSLVPDSWELVRRDQNGAERVLATNVASYDISPDGTIVYTNGGGVFVLEADGTARLALTVELVNAR